MKRLILSLAIASGFVFSKVKAQTVNDVKLSDLKEEYLEVTGGNGINEVLIYLEYGQKPTFSKRLVKDDNGKGLAYSSVIEFINKMKTHGYELFQVYALMEGGSTAPKYILKRKSK
ncbi:MAG: hypothetical protein V4663_06820 [Bacteroidota bacterium]